MRAIIQRVARASVTINDEITGIISSGLFILLGIEGQDVEQDIEWLSAKIVNLRIFNDDNGIMNKSLIETNGNILLVSQFTLFASTRKGNRPSYIKAARPDLAIPLYEQMIAALERTMNKKIQSGIFGADMKIELLNDGPVTIIIDSKIRE